MRCPSSSPATTRRLILAGCVLAAASQLPGCATVAQQCGMRDDYRRVARPESHGTVRLTWAFGQQLSGRDYGANVRVADGVLVSMREAPPSLNDVCALARLGHEVVEAMGGAHE